MFLKPTSPASVIRDPKTNRLLPPEGMRVTPCQFWYRRLRDGSVVAVAEKVAAAPKPKKAKG